MPVTMPGASISEVSKLLQMQDKILNEDSGGRPGLREGRPGRDRDGPAPLEMFETVINLRPEAEWRKGMDVEKIKNEMNDALSIPGVSNSFTMPIKARITCLPQGSDSRGDQDSRAQPGRDRKNRSRFGASPQGSPGDTERLCGESHDGLFPGYRRAQGGDRAVRPYCGRCRGGDPGGHRGMNLTTTIEEGRATQ